MRTDGMERIAHKEKRMEMMQMVMQMMMDGMPQSPCQVVKART